MTKTGDKYSGVTAAAVEKNTGKGWNEWFSRLDDVNVTKLSHTVIARWLIDEGHIESEWWAQPVTVDYEQAPSLRKVNQRADSFFFSVTKTVSSPVADVYDEWVGTEKRARWLAGPREPGCSTGNRDKNLQTRWPGDSSSLIVTFTPKGDDRTQVVVQVEKLAEDNQLEPMHKSWKDALAALRDGPVTVRNKRSFVPNVRNIRYVWLY